MWRTSSYVRFPQCVAEKVPTLSGWRDWDYYDDDYEDYMMGGNARHAWFLRGKVPHDALRDENVRLNPIERSWQAWGKMLESKWLADPTATQLGNSAGGKRSYTLRIDGADAYACNTEGRVLQLDFLLLSALRVPRVVAPPPVTFSVMFRPTMAPSFRGGDGLYDFQLELYAHLDLCERGVVRDAVLVAVELVCGYVRQWVEEQEGTFVQAQLRTAGGATRDAMEAIAWGKATSVPLHGSSLGV